MKTSEIIKALRRMSIETGSLMCLGCAYGSKKCGVHGCSIIKDATQRLEELNNFEKTQTYHLLAQLSAAQADMRKVANSGGDMCLICEHFHKCDGEACPGYTFGVLDRTAILPDGRSLAGMKVTCESFDWGTCDIMRNTPCDGCIDSGFKNFEWYGMPKVGISEND